MRYLTSLRYQVNKPMFGESFGLESIYISLRGYYKRKSKLETVETEEVAFKSEKSERAVIDLHEHLMAWVENANKNDSLRVICGGPGSGKSSFCKMFAARLAEDETRRVLFVTLYHFRLRDDFEDALQKFIDREDEIAPPNPLAQENAERQILLIFDGLDELAMQGKTAARVAREFIDEVQRYLNQKNQNEARVLVLMSGRDLVIQDNQTFFRREGQILHVMPYTQSESEREKHSYVDEHKLLAQD